jgi:hypothetical protein
MTTLYALVSPQDAILEYRDDAPVGDQSLLSPNKPRQIPIVEDGDVAFDPVTEVREGPVATIEQTRVRWTYSKRVKNAAEIAAMRAAKAAAVRAEGTRRLNLLVTMSQQVQALTRLVQLLYLHTDRSGWPAGQQTLATAMLARLQSIQDIRQIEDAKAAEVEVLTDPAAIHAYDETAGWD